MGSADGKWAEDRVRDAANILIKTWSEITQHTANRMLDNIGVDRLFFLRSGLAFPLQVKTSEIGVREHIRKYPHLAHILIHREDSAEEIAERIKAMVCERYQVVSSEPV